MEAMRQVSIVLYAVLGELLGNSALSRANSVVRDAISDGAVDDPTAITVLESLIRCGDYGQPRFQALPDGLEKALAVA